MSDDEIGSNQILIAEGVQMVVNIIEKFLRSNSNIFKDGNREKLRPDYIPDELPHREREVTDILKILSVTMKGARPSNVFIYGKTGTGKTAVIKYLRKQIDDINTGKNTEKNAEALRDKLKIIYINCEVVDTHYQVLANIGNALMEKTGSDFNDLIPFTGWPTEKVYNTVRERLENSRGMVIVALDEVDKLVEKSGCDVLYHLSRINADLTNPRISLIGISNDLKFMEYLDARVKSSLSEEEIIFHPYDAKQLKDILGQRADIALESGAVREDVISLCAALAAKEHGDARRALELLRRAVEIAEWKESVNVTSTHVKMAQNTIESNRMIEVVKRLPVQSRLVLLGVYLADTVDQNKFTTGEIYDIYRSLCNRTGDSVLTQRRITDLISELDMLGAINALVISKGRYGRTREISLSATKTDIETAFISDNHLKSVMDYRPPIQTRLM